MGTSGWTQDLLETRNGMVCEYMQTVVETRSRNLRVVLGARIGTFMPCADEHVL
jgi:hypothetical protein